MTENLIDIAYSVEAALLGSVVLKPACLPEVKELIDPGMFSDLKHRNIWAAILSLQPERLSIISLRDVLTGRDQLNESGGTDYLIEIIDNLPSGENAVYYAKLLKSYSLTGQMRQHSNEVQVIAHDETLTDEQKLYEIHRDYTQRLVSRIRREKSRENKSDKVHEMVEDTIAGRRNTIPLPWSELSDVTNALLNGTITLLCGSAGASKSFMLLQAVSFWSQQDIRCCVYELEENVEYHLLRGLAQQTGKGGLTSPQWITTSVVEAREAVANNAEFLRRLEKCIWASEFALPTLEQLADWIDMQARGGVRVIAVDPITIAEHSRRDTWNEDRTFLERAKRSAVDNQCSVILVTHPTKVFAGPSLESLAGGAAYGRFCQTAIWIENHQSRTSFVDSPCGHSSVDHNRTLHVLKSRNGRGQGLRIAAQFRADTLCLDEIGVIKREAKT